MAAPDPVWTYMMAGSVLATRHFLELLIFSRGHIHPGQERTVKIRWAFPPGQNAEHFFDFRAAVIDEIADGVAGLVVITQFNGHYAGQWLVCINWPACSGNTDLWCPLAFTFAVFF